MPAVYEYRLTVEPADLDALGHVGNVRYLEWMQEAAIAHSTAQGWPPRKYEQTGAAWIVRSHAIEYRRPARENDKLAVFTWVANMRKVRSLRKYRIVRRSDKTELALAQTDWVFVDTFEFRPQRIPTNLEDAFEIVDDG